MLFPSHSVFQKVFSVPPLCQNTQNTPFEASKLEESQSCKHTQQTLVVSDVAATKPETIPIDHVRVEKANTYLAGANMWGQALSQRCD